MGRPTGGKNRIWSKDEKLRIVKRYFDEGLGCKRLAREEAIDPSMVRRWVNCYLDQGEVGLQAKRKSGNPFAALNTSKSMSEVERLRLLVAKQEIEIERLKKGYQVKGDGSSKEFVTTKDANMKSLTD